MTEPGTNRVTEPGTNGVTEPGTNPGTEPPPPPPTPRRLKTLVAVDGISFRFGGKSDLKLPSVTVDPLRYAVRGVAQPSAAPSRPAGSGTGSAAAAPSPSTTES